MLCFPNLQYANVEEKKDPSLKGKAFGVGSGVLTTASVSSSERIDPKASTLIRFISRISIV
jgi:hypothetical protein